MKRKSLVIAILQYIVVANLFSLSPKRVDIYLKNELQTPFIVHCEFLHKENNELPDFPERWTQILMDKSVICGSYVDAGNTMYRPNVIVDLLWYTPNAAIISDAFSHTLNSLAEIPLEQKLKELFKTLVITDAEGNVLLSLDDFSKARVEVSPNGRRYDIIIGEYLYQ